MHDLRLVAFQVLDEQRSFWRNRTAAFFTFAFPIVLLLIFGSLNRNTHITTLGPRQIAYAQYYVPSMVTFGIMSACFINVGTVLSIRRQTGLLKRVRSSPLQPWVFLAGVIGNALLLSVLLTVVIVAVGVAVFSVNPPAHWLATLVTLTVGTVTFCALGIAATLLTRSASAEAAGGVLNAVFMPVVFISGAFFPVAKDSFLNKAAGMFPIRHFITATFAGFDPRRHSSGLPSSDLMVLLAWALAGTLIALRRFEWNPVRS
jgi:ABC-2 type transport system permease protein